MGNPTFPRTACAPGMVRASFGAMNATTALTAKPLTVAERKARLAQLVAEGKVSPEHAKLIGFDDVVTDRDRAIAASLQDKARVALARHGGFAA